jgi:RHS repeat-associated protein
MYDLRVNQTQMVQKDYLSVTINDVTTKYDQTTTYSYNLRDQMTGTTISTPKANQTTGEVTYKSEAPTYIYNEGGQRMKKYEPDDNSFAEDDTTKYFYTGSAVLYTTNNSNELMTENILDPSGQIIASKRYDDDYDPGTTYELANMYFFSHYDIRGSVTSIVRPDGTLIEGYTYDEFGNKKTTEYDENGNPVLNPNNEVFKNEVTFTGSITDMSTGLQYMNARYYDSTNGRFLSQDTYSGSPYEPWTQHLYSYCGNNPTNFVDPTGHKRDETCAGLYSGSTSKKPIAPRGGYRDEESGVHNPVDKAKASTPIAMVGFGPYNLDLSEYSMLHHAVQTDMLLKGHADAIEYPIPGASKNGNIGYADAINSLSASVWEVKPISQYGRRAGIKGVC